MSLNKTNRNKGFTLIELLVVISIIGLLSSIVLASVQSAREKSMLSKTLTEIRSLQNAIEMYRDLLGYYPGAFSDYNYDDDKLCNLLGGLLTGGCGDLENFFSSELVSRKFIPKVPHAPNYPNNCGADCQTKGYILGYSIYDSYDGGISHKDNNYNWYFTCGRKKIDNYFIYFFANSKKLNLPILEYYYNGSYYSIPGYQEPAGGNTYCMAM